MQTSTDVAIIGSGAGGAPLATELALSGARVEVLEAGGPAPVAEFDESFLTSALRVVRDGSMVFSVMMGKGFHTILHGRCEGGSTALNAGSTFRLPGFLQDQWSTVGVDDLEPFFDRADDFLKVTPTDERLFGPGGEKLLQAIETMGWQGGAVPRNAPGCTGRAVCTFGCPENAKRSTQISYLPVARQAGANVRLNSPVKRILFEGRRVVGLEAETREGLLQVKADKVVVSCGALQTPAFLQKNGVKVDGLGENLMIHPEGVLAVHFDEEVEPRGQWVPQSIYTDEFLEGDGIMVLLGSIPASTTIPGLALTGSLRATLDYKKTAYWGILIRDEGNHGHVKAGWAGRDMSYHASSLVRHRMRNAYLHLAKAAFAIGAAAVTPMHIGSQRYTSLTDLERGLPNPLPGRAMLPFSLHSMGTCGIGRVCEPDGRVRGYEGLYVADASLFPTSIGVNPQYTIMALSTMIASHMMQN